MANAIKYSTTGDTQSLRKGNIYFGVGDVGKGPSSATTYYNGVTPASSGYTVYSYNVSQTSKLSYHSASNDAQLITYTNEVSGQNFTGATQCLNWYNGQSNYTCVNMDYDAVVTSGLTLCLDAGFRPSYSTSGVSWYDISYNNPLVTTLVNGPTYSSTNGGSLLFDGSDDNCVVASDGFGIFNNQKYTIEAWVKFSSNNGDIPIFSYDYTSFNYPYYAAHLRHTGTGKVYLGWNMGGFQYELQTTTNTILSSTWYHIVGIVESGRQQIYVNNVLKTSSTQSGPITFYNVPAYVGYYPHAPIAMYGNIAIVRVYNRALSSAEVTTNWNAQKSRFGL
jgi:hypothetical protein